MERLLADNEASQNQIHDYLQELQRGVSSEIAQEVDKIYTSLEDFTRQLEEINALKLDRNDFSKMSEKNTAALNDKVDLSEVQQALNVCQADISARFLELKEEIKMKIRSVETELMSVLSKKASLTDMSDAFGANQKDGRLRENMAQRQRDVEVLTLSLEKLTAELEQRLSLAEFDNHVLQTKKALDVIQSDMSAKANIKDVCALLDTKASKKRQRTRDSSCLD